MSTTSSPTFPSTPAVVASAAPSSAIRVRFVCQGRTGSSKPSSSARSTEDLRASLSDRRERADRSAELRGQPPRPNRLEAAARLEQRDEPARNLEPERRRQRLLQQRSRSHRRRPLRLGQRGQGGREPVELGQYQVERSPCDEHRGGVHDVLARGAPVDVACGVSADGVPKSLHERLRGASDGAPALEQIVEVVQISAALLRDRSGGVFGDDPGGRLGAGERGLELEHRLEPGPPRDGVEQLLRDEERPERRHTAKNVVSASPWRWMSKRRPPSSAGAIRVARSDSSSSERIGSEAFASGSSGK